MFLFLFWIRCHKKCNTMWHRLDMDVSYLTLALRWKPAGWIAFGPTYTTSLSPICIYACVASLSLAASYWESNLSHVLTLCHIVTYRFWLPWLPPQTSIPTQLRQLSEGLLRAQVRLRTLRVISSGFLRKGRVGSRQCYPTLSRISSCQLFDVKIFDRRSSTNT